MTLGMIWAQAHGGVIGLDGDMPWQLPEDLAHFKALTLGHPVIMGRRTWESIPERFRPLAGRRNIVVTRQAAYAAEGAEVVSGLSAALDLVGDDDAWVIGGATLYAAALDSATHLEVTEIDLAVDGDTHAPTIGPEFRALACDPPTGWFTSSAGLRYRFATYARDSL